MVMDTKIRQNARDLDLELAWFTRVLDTCCKLYFGQEAEHREVFEIEPPDHADSSSPYAGFVRHYNLTFVERCAVVLGLVPHIRPQLLDVFFTKNKTFDRQFTEFGGGRQSSGGEFLPTGETLAFILAANNLEIRFALQAIFDPQHFFARHNILRLVPAGSDVPAMKAPLKLSDEYLSLFTTGQHHRPDFGANFPAQYIDTELSWEDLVLHPGTQRQIEEIETWIQHGDTLMND